MRRSFLALLRGSDGRSLARALACLLLANAFIAGVQSGAAAAQTGTVLCSVADSDQPGDSSAPDHHQAACCEMGCAPSLPAIAGSPPELAAPQRLSAAAVFAPASVGVSTATDPTAHGARGPPLLA